MKPPQRKTSAHFTCRMSNLWRNNIELNHTCCNLTMSWTFWSRHFSKQFVSKLTEINQLETINNKKVVFVGKPQEIVILNWCVPLKFAFWLSNLFSLRLTSSLGVPIQQENCIAHLSIRPCIRIQPTFVSGYNSLRACSSLRSGSWCPETPQHRPCLRRNYYASKLQRFA